MIENIFYMNSLRLKKHQLKYIFKFSDRRAGILNIKNRKLQQWNRDRERKRWKIEILNINIKK